MSDQPSSNDSDTVSKDRNVTPSYNFDLSSIDYDDLSEYMSNRVGGAVAVCSVIGASIGYYLGDKTSLMFYSYGMRSAVASSSFFLANYSLQVIRDKDDVYNNLIAGVTTGSLLSFSRKMSVGNTLMKFTTGAVGGGIYYYLGNYLYDTSRNAWISHRRHTLENSKVKKIQRVKPTFVKSEKHVTFGRRSQPTVTKDSSINEENK